MGDHFPYSHDLHVSINSDIVWRDKILITLRSYRCGAALLFFLAFPLDATEMFPCFNWPL